MRRPPKNAQLALALPPPRKKGTWGGARAGAGRPPSRKPGDPLPHVARPALRRSDPVHVTLRAVRTLPSLRSQVAWRAARRALDAAREAAESHKDGRRFQIVHFSVQKDHVHLIVEAVDKRALASGMAGLEVRIARAVNAALRRRGRVWGDRYHRHDLRSPREVKNALRYVLSNVRKHVRVIGDAAFADPWSSAETFDGWSEPIERLRTATEPWSAVAPRTWLLRTGWRRHGLICPRVGPVPSGAMKHS